MSKNRQLSHTKQDSASLLKGRIIAHLGKALLVEDNEGQTALCKKRTQLEQGADLSAAQERC